METIKDGIIYLTSEINEIYSKTKVTQSYTNTQNKPLELSISFPITDDDFTLESFEVIAGDKTIKSKVMKKEKAEEKYVDALAEGNVGIYSEKEKNNFQIVKIGNLQPKERIILISKYIQLIHSSDMSYEFKLMQIFPKIVSKADITFTNIDGKIELKTNSKLTRFVLNNFQNCYKVDKKISENLQEINLTISNSTNEISPLKPSNEYNQDAIPITFFSILFRTEDINNPKLIYQYDSKLDQTTYALSYTRLSENMKSHLKELNGPLDESTEKTYYERFRAQDLNSTPSLFVFLVDQSGSMSGKPIQIVSEALTLFFQSLPEGSYFQLIGFGSYYKLYNEKPLAYTEENLNLINGIIKDLDANLGGTVLYAPLSYIYENIQIYDQTNLGKHLFILTDGEIGDKNYTLEIIKRNSEKFIIQGIGIGNYYDKDLIKKLGKLGNGNSLYIEDVNQLNEAVINTLNNCLRPYFINAKLNINLENINAFYPDKNNFNYYDDPIYFTYIQKGKGEKQNIDLELEMICKGENFSSEITKEKLHFDEVFELEKGDLLSKIVIGNILNKKPLPEGFDEIENAIKYQILSENTALFAEIVNDNSNTQNEMIQLCDTNVFGRFSFDMNNEIIRCEMKCMRVDCEIKEEKCLSKSKKSSRCSNFFSGMFTKCKKNKNKNRECIDAIEINGYKNEPEISCEEQKSTDTNIGINFQKDGCDGSPSDSETREQNNISNENYFRGLISSQNGVQGSWDENEYTKFIVQKFNLEDLLEKVKNYVKSTNNETLCSKICFTFIVIYCIMEKDKEKINESKLVLMKAKKFLEKNGTTYDDIFNATVSN